MNAIQDSVTLKKTTHIDDDHENPTEQLVLRTAQLATEISNLSSRTASTQRLEPERVVAQLHTKVPPHVRPEEDDLAGEVAHAA